MTEERSPLETALDIFVFAPVGVFLALTEDLPRLVERGKTHLQSQLGMARMMGEMAAPQLRDEATKMAKGLVDRVTPPGPPPSPPSPAPAAPKSSPAGQEDASNGAAPEQAAPSPSATPITNAPGIANPDSLAIPGYDSLSAMQVVQRLAGLNPGELDAVRRYEEGHRRRKTIINRAEQLLAEAG